MSTTLPIALLANDSNRVEIKVGSCQLLFSYLSLAAAWLPGGPVIISDCRQSTTTSRHINRFLNLDGLTAKEKKVRLSEISRVTCAQAFIEVMEQKNGGAK